MGTKSLVTFGAFIGSIIGGYLPVLFGVSAFSITSLLSSSVGAIIGIWIGYKIANP